MRYIELLTEMLWADRYEAAKVARQFPRAWIHFTDAEMLEVHPDPSHRDPPGIYFYPVRWLFGDGPSLSQFATERQHYYICKIKPAARILNLARMTMDEVVAIASANGWIADLHEVQREPALLANASQPMQRRLLRRPGGLFYATMDYLANVKHRPWLSLLDGYHGLYDPGRGFISSGEVAQAVVFERRFVEILAHGENTDHHDAVFAGILRQLAAEMGGTFGFDGGLPVASFENAGRPFRIKLDLGFHQVELSYFDQGFWLTVPHRYTTDQGGDWQFHYDSLKAMLNRLAQTAGPAAAPTYWNGDTAAALLRRIHPSRRIIQRVEPDGLHVFELIDSLSGTHVMVNAVATALAIAVTVEILGRAVHCVVHRVFAAGTPIAAAADAVLAEMADQLKRQAVNRPALVKFMDHLGFDFDGQLDPQDPGRS